MRRASSLAALPLCIFPWSSAGAHALSAGAGRFSTGILHATLVGDHLILVLAAGFLIGQQAGRRAWLALAAFAVPFGVGLAIATVGVNLSIPVELRLAASLVLGAAVALAWWPPLPLLIALLEAVGLLLGLAATPEAFFPADAWVEAVAIALASCGILLLAAGLASIEATWLRMGVRVADSWLSATAILLLSLFAFRAG